MMEAPKIKEDHMEQIVEFVNERVSAIKKEKEIKKACVILSTG